MGTIVPQKILTIGWRRSKDDKSRNKSDRDAKANGKFWVSAS